MDLKYTELANKLSLDKYTYELVEELKKELHYDSDIQTKLQPHILSLVKHMLGKGMNISPLPKVSFIDHDSENANNVLGLTAYYDPIGKSITLYTCNRHPKDILRSFSHEMIHHMQNLEGRLQGKIHTQNVNEDDYLREIEREAYELGNMTLREWENSLKNK